jgi:hypothetical protein
MPEPPPMQHLGDRAAGGAVERRERVRRRHRESFRLAEPAVVGLADDRQQPGPTHALSHGIGDHGVAHDAHQMRVGDAHGCRQQALLVDPDRAGHLAVPVERVEPGRHGIGPDVRPRWPDRRHSGAGNRGGIVDDGGMADAHAGHVGDGVERSRRQLAGAKAEVAEPRTRHRGYPRPVGDSPK